MKPIISSNILCPCCGQTHNVATLTIREHGLFKGSPVEYDAQIQLCQNTGETWFTEAQLSGNYRSMEAAAKEAKANARPTE